MTPAAPLLLLMAFSLIAAAGACDVAANAQERDAPAPRDRRLDEVRDPDQVYKFGGYGTRGEWLARAGHLRRQILVSAGLWPMPPKTPLGARVFGRVERAGYSVEKVYFESHPGFFVTGNLYRPGPGGGRRPAVLNPHGHWSYGRLENTETASMPGGAINLARQGHVVFTYDMIGFNDSAQLTHGFGGRREELWGVSLGGLQLWNSIRALDFLLSLPEVDASRVACAGASGGATQAFLLMAVDERVRAGALVNMISAHMQGGCLCENAPGLRIDTSNVELAALAAPRPLLLVSATGDWTRDTLEVEYPAIRTVYRLFDSEDRVRAVRMDAGHNYNRDSREAVYSWLGRWLSGVTDESRLREQPFDPETPAALLVFHGIERPKNGVDAEGLTSYLVASAEKQLDALKPTNKLALQNFREQMRPALVHSLAVSAPAPGDLEIRGAARARSAGFMSERFFVGRKGVGDNVPATVWLPARGGGRGKAATLIVHQDGGAALSDGGGKSPGPLVAELLRKGHLVMAIDAFQTGAAAGARDEGTRFFTTYNRTLTANRVQDILTALAYLKGRDGVAQVNLVGMGKAGLWSLLARGFAPDIGRAAIDAAQFDNASDQSFLDELFAPGLRRAGDLRTAAALAAPSPLLVHNTAERFRTDWIADVYRALGAGGDLQVRRDRLTDAQVADWLQR